MRKSIRILLILCSISQVSFSQILDISKRKVGEKGSKLQFRTEKRIAYQSVKCPCF